MNLIKKIIMYIVVILIVLGLGFMFIKVFAFDKNENIEVPDIPEVTDTLVKKLYNVLPTTNRFSQYSVYTGEYKTKSSTSYNAMGTITFNYINIFDEFSPELVSEEERNNINGNVLYKVNKDIFLKDSKNILGPEVSFKPESLEISDNEKIKLINDYYYVYEVPKEESEYVYYKIYDSYTLTDNKQIIKIYEYYLRCNKNTSICYNTEKDDDMNNYIKYQENINVLDYKDHLKKFEHVFEYDKNHYYWKSTQGI